MGRSGQPDLLTMAGETCFHCKALRWSGGLASCALSYAIDREHGLPKESCPRPLTYLAFNEARDDKKFEEE